MGDDPRRVIGLEMVGRWSASSTGSIGSVPWELSRLPELSFIVLRDNWLQGSIPPELGQLLRLRKLDLSGNFLRDSILAELGQLSKFRELMLQDNDWFTGCILPALVPVCECPALLRCE